MKKHETYKRKNNTDMQKQNKIDTPHTMDTNVKYINPCS